MRFIRGHNSYGMDRSKPHKKLRYLEEDRGFTTPCWIWQLKLNKVTGYGEVRIGGKDHGAHRWYYEQAKGTIPAGLQIDHLCGVRACVNPDHLEAVTPLENTRRSGSSKLTYEQAKDIELRTREDRSSNFLAHLAVEFDVSYETIRLIQKNGADGPRRG